MRRRRPHDNAFGLNLNASSARSSSVSSALSTTRHPPSLPPWSAQEGRDRGLHRRARKVLDTAVVVGARVVDEEVHCAVRRGDLRPDRWVERHEVPAVRHVPPLTYSGGNQQRPCHEILNL